MQRITLALVVVLVASACSGDGAASTDASPTTSAPTPPPTTAPRALLDSEGRPIPASPGAPDGPLDPAVVADLDLALGTPTERIDLEAVARLGASGDTRVAWLLADLLRFFQVGSVTDAAVAAFEELTGTEVTDRFAWGQVTDRLIAWDLPGPPGYVGWKRGLFEAIEPKWSPFFDDEDAAIDWRWLSWGGVYIDDRPLDRTGETCLGCIPALNDPAVTDAAGGDWYPDDEIVFGVVVGSEARAYPRNIMEVHEMVNDTLGGRRIGMPYCTLCGSAQAYFTDDVPAGYETFELRTSGLLSRSNKVMYEFHTFSVFDTFTGEALSGPLQDEEVTLELVSTRTSTWGDWKAAHPGTTIVARDGGIGRSYATDPLGGRDAFGPIFPVGEVDPRRPVQEPVLGVIAPDGAPVAFAVGAVISALDGGGAVEFAGIRVVTDGAGLAAETLAGAPLAAHQAFWFAWSQFHPATLLWPEGEGA